MQHWNTTQIVAALTAALDARHTVRVRDSPGGDYDTCTIVVSRPNPDHDPDEEGSRKASEIEVTGMRHQEIPEAEWNEADVEYVFVCYDRHGMVNASPDEHSLYADIARAIKPLGLRANNQGWKAYY